MTFWSDQSSFFYVLLFYTKRLVQICTSNSISIFSLKIFLPLPNIHSSSNKRTSTKNVLFPDRFSIIFFTVSYTYDCPVSRYTVQDKPLFVITTIQNRISQTVCTSIEHTIELDIWMENTKSFLVLWRHPSDKNNDTVESFSSLFSLLIACDRKHNI